MNKKGITLIELVVVMAIIAIGAVLMIPNIGAWIPNYRLRSASRDIVSTLRVAQVKAVTRNLEHRVTFDTGERSFVLMRRTTAGVNNWVTISLNDEIPADVETAKQYLPQGIGIATTLGSNNAEFNPNSTSSAGSITLTNPKGGVKTITLASSTGRIKVVP